MNQLKAGWKTIILGYSSLFYLSYIYGKSREIRLQAKHETKQKTNGKS